MADTPGHSDAPAHDVGTATLEGLPEFHATWVTWDGRLERVPVASSWVTETLGLENPSSAELVHADELIDAVGASGAYREAPAVTKSMPPALPPEARRTNGGAAPPPPPAGETGVSTRKMAKPLGPPPPVPPSASSGPMPAAPPTPVSPIPMPTRDQESGAAPVASKAGQAGAGMAATSRAAGDGADDIAQLMSEIMASESEAGASSPEVRRTSDAWFAEVFDSTYLKTLPQGFYQRTLRETSFVQESLGFAPGAEILDLGCGFGRHTLELASRGYQMTGLDLSRTLLERALAEARRRGLTVKFVHGDMRQASFTMAFDAIICMHTSFGFFDDRTNFELLGRMYDALRPGGRLLIETVNREYIVHHVPRRIWWDTDELLLMEEVDFDHETSRLTMVRSVVDEQQQPWEQHIRVRLYSQHELRSLLAMKGFKVLEVSGDPAHRGAYLGSVNRHLIVLAERPRG